MEQKQPQSKAVKLYYMYFYRNGKRERSPEYRGLQAFTKACGAWCDKHPRDYMLCSRIAYELVQQ